MTKRDILVRAGVRHGDRTDTFRDDVLAPAFDEILADLSLRGAIAWPTQAAEFPVQAGSTFDLLELTHTAAYPLSVLSLYIPAWGIEGAPQPAMPAEMVARAQQTYGATYARRWALWSVYPDQRTLTVWPPLLTDSPDIGAAATIRFTPDIEETTAQTATLESLRAEDVDTVISGILSRVPPFVMNEDDRLLNERRYEAGASRMWGRENNPRPGRVARAPLGQWW